MENFNTNLKNLSKNKIYLILIGLAAIIFATLLIYAYVDFSGTIISPVPTEKASPYCEAIGSKSEGWYIVSSYSDRPELIRWDNCDGCVAVCKFIGSNSEGWYAEGNCDVGSSLIKYDNCSTTSIECNTDKDCTILNCPGAYCENGRCVCPPITPLSCYSDKDCQGGGCSQVVGGDKLMCDLKTNQCYCGGVCGDGYCDPIEKRDRTCSKDCNGVQPDCTPEGEKNYFGQPSCCEGLTQITNSFPSGDNCIAPTDGSTLCTKCGDGVCKSPENKCNCPKDCEKGKCTIGEEKKHTCPDGTQVPWCVCIEEAYGIGTGVGWACIDSPENKCKEGCAKEGESVPVVPGALKCCEGLTKISCDKPDSNGNCREERCVGASICANCGNGVCGLGENKCNCPKDCEKETGSITITSPNGGEEWVETSTHKITWKLNKKEISFNDKVGIYLVDYSRDGTECNSQGCEPWKHRISTHQEYLSHQGYPSEFLWNVPFADPLSEDKYVKAGDKFKIRIGEIINTQGDIGDYDESDDYFSIVKMGDVSCRDENYPCTPGGEIPCCPGLKSSGLYGDPNGDCSIMANCGTICIPCGNGICDANEGRCNCPEDCKEEQSLSADLNCDGNVNLVDTGILLSFWEKDPSEATSCKSPDINQDGKINLADFSVIMSQWTK